MFTQEEDVLISSAACIVLGSLLKKRRAKPRVWVRPFLIERESTNQFMEELKIDPLSGFKNFTQISCHDFEQLLNKIGPAIAKNDTNYRQCVSVQLRLAITLRYLATGDSLVSLMYLFRVSRQLISRIVPEVCYALISTLKDVIKIPRTEEEWMEVELGFNNLWNFPHCPGAIDGKHVIIQAPSNSGSDYFNYKSQFSIVLFALVDAKYAFTYVDIGCKGRISDGGIFRHSTLYSKLQQGQLNLPPPSNLPGRNKPTPYVIVADDAFALDMHVIKPYAGKHDLGTKERIFNYRLSRARRVIENAFGIMSSLFRVLRKPMLLNPEKAQIVTLACVHLHNYLMKSQTSSPLYCSHGSLDKKNLNTHETTSGSWRRDNTPTANLYPLTRTGRKLKTDAKEIREEFTEYFTTDIGMLSRQGTVA